MKKIKETTYILYDERAIDTDNVKDSAIIEICNTIEEARETAEELGWTLVLWEYESKGETLVNGKMIEVLNAPKEEKENAN